MREVSRYLLVESKEVRYVVFDSSAGERDALVAHGLGGSASSVKDVCLLLAERGWRVIAIDFPGCGMSEWNSESERYSLSQYEGVAARVCEVEGVREGAMWWGVSAGGVLGIRALGKESPLSRRFSELVLHDIGPGVGSRVVAAMQTALGRKPPPMRRLTEYADYLQGISSTTRSRSAVLKAAEETARRGEDGCFLPLHDPRAVSDVLDEAAGGEGVRGGEISAWEEYAGIPPSVRCVIVRGSSSRVLPSSTARRAERQRKNTACLVVQGEGHYPAPGGRLVDAVVRLLLE